MAGGESIVGYAARNEARRLFRRVTPGLDVRIGTEWDGLSLGWSQITIIAPSEPGAGSDGAESFSRFAPPLGWTTRERDGVQRWYGWVWIERRAMEDPVLFVHQGQIGAGVRTSRLARGFQIGAGRTTLLRADPEVPGAYRLAYCTRRPTEGRLTKLREETP